MSTSATSFLVGVSPAVVGAILGIIISAIPILIDTAKTNWRKRFRQQIRLGIQTGVLNFKDIEHVAERWNQDRQSVLQSLRVLHSEAVSGEDSELAKHLETIRGLLIQHQALEPYAELPENISIQLSRLAETVPNDSKAISQLAASLSELYSSNQRELSKQKKFSFWGFVVGVIGVMLSIPGLYVSLKL